MFYQLIPFCGCITSSSCGNGDGKSVGCRGGTGNGWSMSPEQSCGDRRSMSRWMMAPFRENPTGKSGNQCFSNRKFWRFWQVGHLPESLIFTYAGCKWVFISTLGRSFLRCPSCYVPFLGGQDPFVQVRGRTTLRIVHHYSGELTLLLVKQDVIKCVSSLPCFFGNRPSGNGNDKPGEMMAKQMTNPKAGSSSASILKGTRIFFARAFPLMTFQVYVW